MLPQCLRDTSLCRQPGSDTPRRPRPGAAHPAFCGLGILSPEYHRTLSDDKGCEPVHFSWLVARAPHTILGCVLIHAWCALSILKLFTAHLIMHTGSRGSLPGRKYPHQKVSVHVLQPYPCFWCCRFPDRQTQLIISRFVAGNLALLPLITVQHKEPLPTQSPIMHITGSLSILATQ